MNRRLVTLLFAMVVTLLALMLACGGGSSGGGGDDDNQADDDNQSDDDSQADDDQTGGLTVSNISTGQCLDDTQPPSKATPWDPLADPTNVVEVTWQGGVLKIDDLFSYVNCCVALSVDAAIESNTVTVTETDTGSPCNCNCPFNFHYDVSGITADQIHLVVKRGGDSGFTVAELDLPLGATNKKWFIPYVEVFAANGGTSNTDPVILAFAACNLYHLADQQIYTQTQPLGIFAYGYDWFDVDNPGNFDPTCQMPVNINLGAMASGVYFFGAPSHNSGVWSLLPAPLTIP